MLRQGATVRTVVVPAGPTPDLAPILRVADSEKREILLLAQDGGKLVFGIRTGAAILRLRPPLFALSGVFPERPEVLVAPLERDTLQLSASYTGRQALIHAVGRLGARDVRASTAPPLAWALLLPVQWYLEGTRTERLLTDLWVGFLLFPVGYWASYGHRGLARRYRNGSWGLAAITVAALLGAGFKVIPLLFGVAPAPVVAWVAAVAGLALGNQLARSVGK